MKKIKQILAEWILCIADLFQFNCEIEQRNLRKKHERDRINDQWLSEKPDISDMNYFLSHIPDRYSDCYQIYRKDSGFIEYKDFKKWVFGNYKNNAGDLGRFFFLSQCLELLIKENVLGHVAELGVYKGNSAFLLSRFARLAGKTCYLFDTFEGFDKRDLPSDNSGGLSNCFLDTSVEEVKKLVGSESTVYVKGYFPESLGSVDVQGSFAFVHIDCDLGKPFKAALEFFYPRLCRGGFLVMHDYSSYHWPGVANAVDEFFSDKPEFVIPVPDKSGSCVVRKI